MRTLPNMTVVVPGDPIETAMATQAIIEWPGPCYLRLGRARELVVHQTSPNFQIGKAIVVREGSDVTLIATGGILSNTMQAAEQLAQQGIQARVLSMPTIKPLDTAHRDKPGEDFQSPRDFQTSRQNTCRRHIAKQRLTST